ncbi:MAG: BT_3928 family protein [Flavobacteriales bacterium]
MKYLIVFSRIVIGILFILSGWVKLVDPIGFSYQLEEYCSPSVFDIPFLIDLSLILAVFLSLYESLSGLMLLLGIAKKFTIINLSILMLFFSFLTFYSAYLDKITDCGCFGDALPLTPWQSFGKNILLFFFILSFIGGRSQIRPCFNKGINIMLLLVTLIGLLVTAYRGVTHLPMIDFRPYAIGKSITVQIKTVEELGFDSPQYQILYTLKNTQDQSEKTVTDKEYINQKLWMDSHWSIQADKTVRKKIKNGYKPLIHDFVLRKGEQDITKEILDEPFALLVICYDLLKADLNGLNKIKTFITSWKKTPVRFIGLSSSETSEQLGLSWIFGDVTLLKTIVRSNPGLVLLKKGTIVKKWHWRDTPTLTEFQNLID